MQFCYPFGSDRKSLLLIGVSLYRKKDSLKSSAKIHFICSFIEIPVCLFLKLTYFHIGQVVAKVSKIYPKDVETPAGGVDDMTKPSYLHEPGVLCNLATRYESSGIYVRFILSLVSIN